MYNKIHSLLFIIALTAASIASNGSAPAPSASSFQQVANQYLKTGFKNISNSEVATLIIEIKKKDPSFNPDSILRDFAAEKLTEGKSPNDVAQAMMDIVGQVMKVIPPRPMGVAVTDNHGPVLTAGVTDDHGDDLVADDDIIDVDRLDDVDGIDGQNHAGNKTPGDLIPGYGPGSDYDPDVDADVDADDTGYDISTSMFEELFNDYVKLKDFLDNLDEQKKAGDEALAGYSHSELSKMGIDPGGFIALYHTDRIELLRARLREQEEEFDRLANSILADASLFGETPVDGSGGLSPGEGWGVDPFGFSPFNGFGFGPDPFGFGQFCGLFPPCYIPCP